MKLGICLALAIVILNFPQAALAAETCTPISAVEIEKQWSHYSSLPGVQPNGGGSKYECIAIDSTQQLVCRTKPENPAHPSIVIRTVVKEAAGISLRTEADTAGDCVAFQQMMDQFKGLTAKARDDIQK
jgi:hypothetical protein